MPSVWMILVVFLLSAVSDLLIAWYLTGVAKGRLLTAFVATGLLSAVKGTWACFIVSDPWLILPGALGEMAGTALAVWWLKRKVPDGRT
jgi:hypothetical protein